MNSNPAFLNIRIESWDGPIPPGHDLVIHERDGDPADGCVLYGFDEAGLFDHEFNNPAYSFIDRNRWVTADPDGTLSATLREDPRDLDAMHASTRQPPPTSHSTQ